MKKFFLFFLIFNLVVLSFSQESKYSKYSMELKCINPKTYNVQEDISKLQNQVDLEFYKTVIRNGDINAIEKPYLRDLELGVLSKTELKLFRNMFYAKKGYIFTDKELEKYFSQFDWYKPVTKDIQFTDLEKTAIERIQMFEAESTITYEYSDKDIVWEYWNGGANERGPLLKLSKDKTFEYTPAEVISRLISIKGTWSIVDNKVVLSVTAEKVFFGGYIDGDPCGSYVNDGTPVTITYEQPLKITLPLNSTDVDKKYGFGWSEKWIMIGSCECYISKY